MNRSVCISMIAVAVIVIIISFWNSKQCSKKQISPSEFIQFSNEIVLHDV